MKRQVIRWNDRPAAAKVRAAAWGLVLTIVGVAALDSAYSRAGATSLAVFTMDGPGAQFATTYELRDDGVLESTRRAVGGGTERRRLVLAPFNVDRYLELLETGGYLTEDPEELRLPEVRNKLGAAVDVPHWTVRVRRSPIEVVSVEVPAPVLGEFFPSLNDIAYVTAAWQLIGEFEESWEGSQRVPP